MYMPQVWISTSLNQLFAWSRSSNLLRCSSVIDWKHFQSCFYGSDSQHCSSPPAHTHGQQFSCYLAVPEARINKKNSGKLTVVENLDWRLNVRRRLKCHRKNRIWGRDPVTVHPGDPRIIPFLRTINWKGKWRTRLVLPRGRRALALRKLARKSPRYKVEFRKQFHTFHWKGRFVVSGHHRSL